MQRLILLGLAGLIIISAQAQTNDPAPAIRDFADGVAKFEALGFPDVNGGTYVALTVHDDGPSCSSHYYGCPELTGNAWLINTNNAPVHTFIINEAPIELVYGSYMDNMRSRTNETQLAPMGSWNKIDVKTDISNIQAFLDKPAENDRDWEFERSRGKYFLFALHIYQAGYTNEANQMIDTMIKRSPNPRDLIASGINEFADTQYQNACKTFYASNDWTAFAAQLQELLARFTSGWEAAPGVNLLLTKVQNKTARKETIPTEITPEQQALINALLTETNSYNSGMGSTPFWQYDDNSVTERNTFVKPDTNHPVYQIKSMGIAGVPFFLKLLSSDAITPMPLSSVRGFSSGTAATQNPMKKFFSSTSTVPPRCPMWPAQSCSPSNPPTIAGNKITSPRKRLPTSPKAGTISIKICHRVRSPSTCFRTAPNRNRKHACSGSC